MQNVNKFIKRWILGYKLHLTCTTGSFIVPLTADVTTANVPDNQKVHFFNITINILSSVLRMTSDAGYEMMRNYKSIA